MGKKTVRTMEDFAETVGLSRPTVSKYFQDPASVRKKMRQRIETGLDETGFRPNLLAVNLNRRHTRIIGLIFPNSLDPFYMELRRLIENRAREAGYLSFVFSSEGNSKLEAEAIETLTSLNAAGVIMAPVAEGSHHAKLKSLARNFPVVFVDAPFDNEEAFVGTDNQQSMGLITDYLTRFDEPPCYFSGANVNSNTDERRVAYLSTMRDRNLEPVLVSLASSDDWDFERYAFDETSRILAEGGFPTQSVVCCNDRLAFGVLAAAHQAGLKVGIEPDCDLRVAGHDDHPFSRFTVPPLTTVSQNIAEIGRLAIGLLFSKIEGAPTSDDIRVRGDQIRTSAELVLRSSA